MSPDDPLVAAADWRLRGHIVAAESAPTGITAEPRGSPPLGWVPVAVFVEQSERAVSQHFTPNRQRRHEQPPRSEGVTYRSKWGYGTSGSLGLLLVLLLLGKIELGVRRRRHFR